MARKGFLTPKTYFPKKGDILECEEDGSTLTCMRVGTIIDEQSGTSLRFAPMLRRIPDLEVPGLPVWSDNCTNITKELEDVDTIYRSKGGDLVAFRKNEKGVFEEE